MKKEAYTTEAVDGKNDELIAVYEGNVVLDNLILDFYKPGIFKSPESKIVGMRVKGNLTLKGDLINEEDDENTPSLTVDGSLKANRIILGSAQISIKGDVDLKNELVTSYNHGSITIDGDLTAKIVAAEYGPAVEVKGTISGYVVQNELVYLYTKGKKDEKKIYSLKGVLVDSLVKNGKFDGRSAAKKLLKNKPIVKDSFITLEQEMKKLLGKKLEKPLAVKSLSLYLKPLPIFPKEVFLFENLEDLNLESTDIPYVPKEIGKLTKLKRLNLKGNGLTEIPEEIGELKELESLDLEANCILGLPKGLAGCTALKQVNLHNNPYAYAPKVFGSFSKIKAMNEFPEVLTELESLEIFDIDQTFIKTLPSKPFKSKNLQPIAIKSTLIPVKKSDLHPQLTVDVKDSSDWALSHINFWTDRWEAVHTSLLEKNWKEAAAVYEVLMDILIPITEPYTEAFKQLQQKLDDTMGYESRRDRFAQTFPQGFTPFFRVLKERMMDCEKKYPNNALIKKMIAYAEKNIS